jgi:hypothetical protein
MYFRIFKLFQVENIGFEPMTSSMPWKRPDRSGPAELSLDLTLNVLPDFQAISSGEYRIRTDDLFHAMEAL